MIALLALVVQIGIVLFDFIHTQDKPLDESFNFGFLLVYAGFIFVMHFMITSFYIVGFGIGNNSSMVSISALVGVVLAGISICINVPKGTFGRLKE